MGYTTDFNGEFTLDRALASEHLAYLKAFNETRRMKRDAAKAEKLPDPVRVAAGLPIGDEGGYFVGGGGEFGQGDDESVVDHNTAPGQRGYGDGDFQARYDTNQRRIGEGRCQPGLWCQWVPSEDGTMIVWDEGEKFYEYVAWLKYIVEHFLKPWGYVLNGRMTWQGEEPDDSGVIRVTDNVVEAAENVITNPLSAKP